METDKNHLSKTKKLIENHIQVASETVALVLQIEMAAKVISDSVCADGKLLVCGNGGSAADAQHIAAELVGRFLKERRPLPAIALHVNTSSLTAIGNDYHYDQVFVREVLAHGRNGDVLLALSTSGNSKNVVNAVRAAREKGMKVISLTGASGGQLKEVSDITLCVPSNSTPRIQEMHILLGHIICELVEDSIC